jgi:hypothetical protein
MSGTAAVVATVAEEPVDVDESAVSGELPPTDGDSLTISTMLTLIGGALLLVIIALRMRKN